MAREEVPKKIIDSDSFPVNRSKPSFDMANQEGSPQGENSERTPPGGMDTFSATSAAEDLRNGFSLDVFEIPDEEDHGIPSLESDEESTPPTQQSESHSQDDRTKPALRFPGGKKLWIALCASLVVIVGGFVASWSFYGHRKPLEIVTSIKRPIIMPHYQERLDFLFLAQSQSDKEMVSLGLEVEFRRPDYYQKFKDENVLFRDVIYRFLESQHPFKNTPKDWQPIVQDELPIHLKAVLPESQAEVIRVSHFEAL